MTYSRTEFSKLTRLKDVAETHLQPLQTPPADENFAPNTHLAHRRFLRDQRDLERGYRISVKQVVLAFTIEFFIIGIGLAGWYFFSSSPQALLYPLALALVELARVPLAIAVRTQKSWNIQFAALVGVCAAVVVTSSTLYQIGELTFSPRRAAVFEKASAVDEAKRDRQSFLDQKAQVQAGYEQINKDWQSLSATYDTLAAKLNSQSGNSQNCTTVEVPTTAPDGTPRTTKRTSCARDPAFTALEREIAATKTKRDEAFKARTDWQIALNKFDSGPYDKAVAKAESEHRAAINQSPLHSYTAMLFGKDQRDVTEGEVKTLEWWLLLIPSIAAALSSTLVAMTAVHRIKPLPQSSVELPDEATAYLFGPLLQAIREEATATIKSIAAKEADGAAKSKEAATT